MDEEEPLRAQSQEPAKGTRVGDSPREQSASNEGNFPTVRADTPLLTPVNRGGRLFIGASLISPSLGPVFLDVWSGV